jgi:S1-C subfamily serine protease
MLTQRRRVFDEGRSSVVTVLSVEVRAAAATCDTHAAEPLRQSRNGEVSEEPLGAGVVWDQRGYVVTNYHVVARLLALESSAGGAAPSGGANPPSTSAPVPPPPATASSPGSLRVALLDPGDGTVKDFPATLVGASPAWDLAVLLLADAPPEFMLPVPLGSSAAVRVGQSAFALSLNALSYGIVSGLRRPLPSPAGSLIPGGALQTDATIDAGNSGGALLDSSGRLLGLCTAPVAAAARSSGPPARPSSLGFAIPVDAVRFVVPQLIAYGRVQDAA